MNITGGAPLWPTLNALLNLTAFVLLAFGFWAIRSGRKETHRWAMVAAFATSLLFLLSYIGYHFRVGSAPFRGAPWLRAVYLVVLIPHTVLAALVAPLAVRTLVLALSGRFDDHRRWARRTWPIWIFVSLSGVLVYWMLYQRG